MSIYGYRLMGNAKSMSPAYIPSLIGVDRKAALPAGTDTYFERVDLPAAAINLNSLALTRWDSYDSRTGERDPIIAAKAGTLSFYSTLSELVELADEFGDDTARQMVRQISNTYDGAVA